MPETPPISPVEPSVRRSGGIGRSWKVGLAVLSVATGLTVLFWPTLWQGGGLIGGDIYYYYLPQKAYYAQCLRAGTLPLWNNLVGNGYPQLAESQTGALYPVNLALYGLLDLNGASSASVLLHYVLAFVGCWLLARRLGLHWLAALLSALVYTYSWFPPRISLEWSIVGGAWLPWAVWCVESFLQRRLWRYALWLTVILAMQLLAGHFLVAFLTQLLIVGYLPLRVLVAATEFAPSERPEAGSKARIALALWLYAAIAGSYLLAAAQLVPTWELKQQSQRAGINVEHDPGYGSIPPRYLGQLVAPWSFYFDPGTFEALKDPERPPTNRVEAHLYFGLMPLLLVAAATVGAIREGDWLWVVWFVIGLLAVLYSPGWFLPITNRLPGFSFFEGPGRYGLLATLAAALLAGAGFEAGRRRLKPSAQPVFIFVVFLATTADLYWVAGLVHNAQQVENPPVKRLPESKLRARFGEWPEPARAFNEANNIPSLVGVATLPVYLGLSPGAYYDPQLKFPPPDVYPFAEKYPSDKQLDWLRRRGVTHILSLNQINPARWSARPAGVEFDYVLNPPLSRNPTDGFWIYELEGSRGRVGWLDSPSGPKPLVREYSPHRVEVAADSEQGGTLVLTDLSYPGWQVAVDGEPAEGLVVDGMLRGVDLPPGEHTVVWTYRPASFRWGALISLATLFALLTLGHVRYWHPGLLRRRTNGTNASPTKSLPGGLPA